MLCSRANLKRWNEGEVNQDLPFDRLAQSAHFVFVILVRKARTRGLSSKFPLLREGAPEANLGRHNSTITAMSVGISRLCSAQTAVALVLLVVLIHRRLMNGSWARKMF